jgi:MinD superfamily P-loop ATPase
MEIAIISGKGGTGKSSISAAFATMQPNIVLADCDVDAANLYILFNPTHEEQQSFISGYKAVIDKSKCTNCSLCLDHCRFDAIANIAGEIEINETSCDGCFLCSRICPEEAIAMVKEDESKMYAGTFRNGKMVYGRLSPGEENSGRLVDIVREKAKEIAKKEQIETIILDGPPGIGCPVISTITGVEYVVVVTEPTLSGLHDLKRTLEITTKFKNKTTVIINKFDLNVDMANTIETYCAEQHITVIGKIPFDPQVVESMVHCQSIIEYAPTSEVATMLKMAFSKIHNT